MVPRHVWLGSGSKSRLDILAELARSPSWSGTQFHGKVSADIDEKSIRFDDPKELVIALAHAKADAILEAKRDELLAVNQGGQGEQMEGTGKVFLITCDQVVVHKDKILEKPESDEEARGMIRGYAEAPAMTVGSTVVTDIETGKRLEQVDVATIRFKKNGLPKDDIEFLLKEGEVFWCAGGLMVEHERVQPHVECIEGGMDAVMGLRQQTVTDLIHALHTELL
jgi:septum formation protein